MKTLDAIYRNIAGHINVYRAITAAGFILVVILVMAIPARMSGASPWAYYYGVKNFSEGKFVLTDFEMGREMADAMKNGGILMQYVKTGNNEWALEKAPGYVFYLVPFKWIGIPRWGNILLMAGMVIVTYLLLKRLRNEKAACIGSLLIMFAPIGLIMANRAYMDTFASLAFLAVGGGLYFLYLLEQEKWGRMKGGSILFMAFLFISWSVVVRYSNLPVAIIVALHYVIIRINSIRKGNFAWIGREVAPVIMGIGLPAAVLLVYNNYIFGSPLDYGYNYTPFPVKFAYEYLGQADRFGNSIPFNIIIDNFKTVPPALLMGFPALVIFVPSLNFLLFRKFSRDTEGRWKSIKNELPWGILLVFIGWFLSVYVLYMMYEFTAEYLKEGTSFFRYSRYYLPGLFPIAIISALVLARLPQKLTIPVMFLITASGMVFYFQVALNINA